MIIRNIFKVRPRIGPSSHGGSGEIEHFRVFDEDTFATNLCLVAADVIPPSASIDEHFHAHDEEMYIVLEGEGVVTVDGKDKHVEQGDVVLVTPGHSHGIRNDASISLKILVIEATLAKTAGSKEPSPERSKD